MILLVHLLFGAAIGSRISNIPLAIILAYFAHYFLDFFPHIEYDIENIRKKEWKKATPDILRVVLDFSLGILLIFLFSNPSAGSGQPIVFICAFFTILPDGFTILNYFFPNKILKIHDKFHEKIQFLKHKKISSFWRITTQIIVATISAVLLRS